MDMDQPRILVLGHSFVRRLDKFLQGKGHDRLRSQLYSLGCVRLYGKGGRTVEACAKKDLCKSIVICVKV